MCSEGVGGEVTTLGCPAASRIPSHGLGTIDRRLVFLFLCCIFRSLRRARTLRHTSGGIVSANHESERVPRNAIEAQDVSGPDLIPGQVLVVIMDVPRAGGPFIFGDGELDHRSLLSVREAIEGLTPDVYGGGLRNLLPRPHHRAGARIALARIIPRSQKVSFCG